MNKTELAKILAGPIIGAAIALIAIWAKEFFEGRKSVQTWFEEEYIFQGVDLLIAHFIVLEAFLLDQKQVDERLPKILSAPPDDLRPEVIAKLQAILNSRVFFVSASFIRHMGLFQFDDGNLKELVITECVTLAKTYNAILIDLRKQLLKIRLGDKTDVYNILRRHTEISDLLDQMHTAHIKMATKLDLKFQVNEKGHLT